MICPDCKNPWSEHYQEEDNAPSWYGYVETRVFIYCPTEEDD